MINYELTSPIPGRVSLVQWNSGYINIRELIFNATHQIGNALRRDRYETEVQLTATLFHTTMLGALKVPEIQCPHASFTLGLSALPIRRAGASIAPPDYSLMLSGTYSNVTYLRPALIPVQVIISDPIELNTVWLSNVVINKTSYTAVIELNLDKLTNSITTGMMNNAVITNGTIFITSVSNQNLYEIIVNNLQGNNMNARFWAPIFNIANFPVE